MEGYLASGVPKYQLPRQIRVTVYISCPQMQIRHDDDDDGGGDDVDSIVTMAIFHERRHNNDDSGCKDDDGGNDTDDDVWDADGSGPPLGLSNGPGLLECTVLHGRRKKKNTTLRPHTRVSIMIQQYSSPQPM
ncbi:hypothetical protein ElyMa_000758300 [Elysia marginata]|uniref:Uncharacterized protein n=1 Tax=Elysia marginata TaxID=1093978 RepID=A0AAV4GSZ7_9GAST|nr:hypothetical protein ElyMa_000758300 [Elysia marginata]